MAVSLIAWNRPHYLRQVLDAWAKVRGVGDVLFDCWCEPGCEEAVALCESVDYADRRVHVNPVRLGNWRNTQRSMDGSFEVAPYVIQAVDDNVPSADILELHAWHRDNYADDQSVLALAAGRNPDPAEGGPAAIWRTQVMGWLPGFQRDRWEMLSARWDGADHPQRGWWGWISESWCFPCGLDILRPALSRAQDIGEVGSKPLPYSFDMIYSKCFSEDYPPQQFFEVPGKRERGYELRVEAV